MPVRQRHSEEITRERECKNMAPSIWQQLVETHNALRETERAFRWFAFRKYRLSRAKMDRTGETPKFADLGRVDGCSAEQDWKDSAGHLPPHITNFPN